MNNETLKALEGSICKWDDICMGYGEDYGSDDCPLCAIFIDFVGCNGCPVSAVTGKSNCHDTPYDEWYDVYRGMSTCRISQFQDQLQVNIKKLLIGIAEEELIFLIELLPEGHKWK